MEAMRTKQKSKLVTTLRKQVLKEINLYHKTKDTTYLIQASEKTWVMFTLLVELHFNKKIKSEKVLWKYIQRWEKENPTILKPLIDDLWVLHIYHYEADVPPEFIEESVVGRIKRCLKLMGKIKEIIQFILII